MAWKKGESGNPGGRPKKVLELVELARSHCHKAVAKAAKLLNDADGRVVIAAAVFLRDTGMGRPASVELDIAQVSDESLLAEVKRRNEKSQAEDDTEPMGGGALNS